MADDRKLLAEWFWTDRWMGSRGFLLPMEPRGLYREMLTQAWRRGARLPNDHEEIRRAVGCTLPEWRRAWPKIQQHWRVDGDFLVNDTQLEVYAEALGVQQRAHERGVKGAQARAQARAQVVAQAPPEQPLKIQPPSPSPTVLPERSPGEPPAPAKPPVDRVRAFIDRYRSLHEQYIGVAYLGNPHADYQEACTLAATFDDALLEKLTVYWLNDRDKFATDGTRTIAKMRSRASKYVEELKARKLA